MTIGIAEPRPPYVSFETRSVEDRQASIDAGRMIYKDVDFALITPQGSKDRFERIASEWLAHIEVESRQDRFDPRWVDLFKRNYQNFLDNKEPEVDGTSLKDWPSVTPAQIKNFHAINVRSVEDIANANEETIMRMGMGARELQNRARNWIKASEGPGKLAEQISSLQVENEGLKHRNSELTTQIAQLSQRLAFLEANGGSAIQAPPQKEDEHGDLTFQ